MYQHVSLALFMKMASVVLFALAGLGTPEAPKFKYIGWGLALYAAADIIPY